MHLFVRSAFGGRAVGDRITDPAEVASVLAGEYEHHVAKIAADDPAPPAVVADAPPPVPELVAPAEEH